MNKYDNDVLQLILNRKIFFFICIIFGSCSTKSEQSKSSANAIETDTIQSNILADDTFTMISNEMVQQAYQKSMVVHSHHSLLKNEFPFDNWLTAVTDQDTFRINSMIDRLLQNVERRDIEQVNNSTAKWTLAYYVSRGWFEHFTDKTYVNRYFTAHSKQLQLTPKDISNIFKHDDGWHTSLVQKNQLIVRYQYSYLHGNQTSWDYEHVYLFTRKANE